MPNTESQRPVAGALIDDGHRDSMWVCSKCGKPCGFRRKRPLYGYDLADAHCFTEGCRGGAFCTSDGFATRQEVRRG